MLGCAQSHRKAVFVFVQRLPRVAGIEVVKVSELEPILCKHISRIIHLANLITG